MKEPPGFEITYVVLASSRCQDGEGLANIWRTKSLQLVKDANSRQVVMLALVVGRWGSCDGQWRCPVGKRPLVAWHVERGWGRPL